MRGLLNHRLFPALAISAVVILLPLVFPSAYYYRVAALVFVFALAAVGLNLLMGFAGQVSLGHAGFMGIGAYAVAIGPAHLGLPSWLSFVGGAGLSAFVAFAVGRPILRLKGHYLAVATLGFGLLLAIAFSNEARFTGGPDGPAATRVPRSSLSSPGSTASGWASAGPVHFRAPAHPHPTPNPARRAPRAR